MGWYVWSARGGSFPPSQLWATHSHMATKKAKGQFIPAAIFFFSFITLGAFILANVISAVVVAAYNETSAALKKAHEMKFRALKTELKATTGQKHFQRPVVEMPLSDEKVWSSQVPLEVPDFDKISKEKLERYFLVLSVIEENLREYVLTKEEIQVVCFLRLVLFALVIALVFTNCLREDSTRDPQFECTSSVRGRRGRWWLWRWWRWWRARRCLVTDVQAGQIKRLTAISS